MTPGRSILTNRSQALTLIALIGILFLHVLPEADAQSDPLIRLRSEFRNQLYDPAPNPPVGASLIQALSIAVFSGHIGDATNQTNIAPNDGQIRLVQSQIGATFFTSSAPLEKPAIITEPQGLTAASGANVSLIVLASGTEPVSYQWRRNGTDLLNETNMTLAFTPATNGSAGSYTVVLTNALGSVTSSVAVLTIFGTEVTAANMNSIWTAANSPYIAHTNVTVTNLTIQAGVTVLLSSNTELRVTGFVQAVGTSNNLIKFKRLDAGFPWQGILLSSALTNCQFDYCWVEGANNSGIRFQNTPLTVRHCTITNNTAFNGGGINTDGTLTLQDCQILNNLAASHSGLGGGIYYSGGVESTLNLVRCTISGNTVTGVAVRGGGIGSDTTAMIIATDCVFSTNRALGAGGDDSFQRNNAYGGGIYTSGPLNCQRTKFSGNVAQASYSITAGGIYSDSQVNLTACDLIENQANAGGSVAGGGIVCAGLRGISCQFIGNSANCLSQFGGNSTYGAAVVCGNSGALQLTNCIVARNTTSGNSLKFEAISVNNSSAGASFMNCVFYGNTAGSMLGVNGNVSSSIFWESIGSGNLTINYSLLQGANPGIGNIDGSSLPLTNVFANSTNFILAPESPAIDAGDPSSSYNDAYFPPSLGNLRNDMGAYGGLDTLLKDTFGAPQVFYNGNATPPLSLPNTNKIQISIQSTFTNGIIRYSLNGDDPIANGLFYSSPFDATVPALLQAIAFDSEFIHSATIAPVDLTYIPLNVTVPGGGTVTNNPPTGPYLINSSVTLTAATNSGWTFVRWAGDSTRTNSVIVIPINTNKSVQAVFGTAISTSTSGGGAISLNPPIGPYPYGSVIRCTPVPSNGKYLSFWGGAASGGSGNPLNFTVTNANPTISAFFSTLPANKFSLAVLTTGSGNVTESPFAANYASGQTVTLLATPDADWVFTGWSGDMTSTANPLDVTMNTNKIVTASFLPAAPAKITSQPQSLEVNRDSNAVFTVGATGVPAPAYQWFHSGTNLPGATSATLSIPSAQRSDGGSYFVIVTNLFCSVTSSVVTLTVNLPYTFITLAGLAGQPGSDDGTGNGARFNGPVGVGVDSAGNVFVADYNNHTIRKVTPAGVVTTLAGLAGSSGSANGSGNAARFNTPHAVAVDSSNDVYVADTYNHTIRKITPAGMVTTFAGLAGSQGSADGTGSIARFYYPFGLAVDSVGNIWVGDSFNNTIRKITSAGVVTTLAGLAENPGSADGTGSTARFSNPEGVAVDSAGNIAVADYLNHTIRKVTPAGVVTTLAGLAQNPGVRCTAWCSLALAQTTTCRTASRCTSNTTTASRRTRAVVSLLVAI